MSWLLALLTVLLHTRLLRCQCNIRREALTPATTFALLDEPYVIVRDPNSYKTTDHLLREKSDRKHLLEHYGESTVTLTSSNSFAHGSHRMTLERYILDHVDGLAAVNSYSSCIATATDMHGSCSGANASSNHRRVSSNESLYLFGNNYNGVFADLESIYSIEECSFCKKAGMPTIGIGGRGSGVNFHYHGPGFQEVIHGSKRWFLVKPGTDPSYYHYHPNKSVSEWVTIDYSEVGLPEGQSIYDCVLQQNELLYFPRNYMHATLNLDDYNVFVSLFIDPQLI